MTFENHVCGDPPSYEGGCKEHNFHYHAKCVPKAASAEPTPAPLGMMLFVLAVGGTLMLCWRKSSAL